RAGRRHRRELVDRLLLVSVHVASAQRTPWAADGVGHRAYEHRSRCRVVPTPPDTRADAGASRRDPQRAHACGAASGGCEDRLSPRDGSRTWARAGALVAVRAAALRNEVRA